MVSAGGWPANCTPLVGLAGLAGAPGPPGESIQGIPGSVGPSGEPGAQGSPGIAGLAGSPGINGINGINGVKGDTGAVGATGSQGSIGLTGAAGPPGQVGSAGAVGSIGLTGLTGPAGQGIDALGNLAVNNITFTGTLSNAGPNPTGIHLSDGAGGDTVLSSHVPANGTLQINGVPIPMGASPTASGSFTVSTDGTEVAFWCSPTLQSIPNWSNATCLGPQSLIIPTGAGHAGVGGVWFGVSVPGLSK